MPRPLGTVLACALAAAAPLVMPVAGARRCNAQDADTPVESDAGLETPLAPERDPLEQRDEDERRRRRHDDADSRDREAGDRDQDLGDELEDADDAWDLDDPDLDDSDLDDPDFAEPDLEERDLVDPDVEEDADLEEPGLDPDLQDEREDGGPFEIGVEREAEPDGDE